MDLKNVFASTLRLSRNAELKAAKRRGGAGGVEPMGRPRYIEKKSVKNELINVDYTLLDLV